MATKRSMIQDKYDKAHCKRFSLKLNTETDKDIIEKLANVESMQGYIKKLIRDDISRTRTHSSVPDSVPILTRKKHPTTKELLKALEPYTADHDGSMYELLNALCNAHMNE